MKNCDRIFALTQIQSDDCIEVIGMGMDSYGYPSLRYQGMTRAASRAAWIMNYGNLSPTQHVLHSCDNRLCVNLRHLRLGTNRDNVSDRVSRNREGDRRGVRNGRAKFDEAKVLAVRSCFQSGMTPSQIQKLYSCSLGCIEDICYGRSWRHL